MRSDVIESITQGIPISFEYKAGGEYGSDSPKVVTERIVRPTKFYSDFTGFTGYDTDKQEDRNFRFERVQKWKGLYGNEVDFKIEIYRTGTRLEFYTVTANDEDEARELFEQGEYNKYGFNDENHTDSYEVEWDNHPEDCEISTIEKA